MKQLRQMSILVRGAQLLLLVLALFLVVWLVPDAPSVRHTKQAPRYTPQ